MFVLMREEKIRLVQRITKKLLFLIVSVNFSLNWFVVTFFIPHVQLTLFLDISIDSKSQPMLHTFELIYSSRRLLKGKPALSSLSYGTQKSLKKGSLLLNKSTPCDNNSFTFVIFISVLTGISILKPTELQWERSSWFPFKSKTPYLTSLIVSIVKIIKGGLMW